MHVAAREKTLSQSFCTKEENPRISFSASLGRSFLIGARFVSFLMVRIYLSDHWYDWLNFGLFNA